MTSPHLPWHRQLLLADRDNRIAPGHGPRYTRRVLPAVIPVRRSEVLNARLPGVTRAALIHYFTTLTRGVIMLRADLTVEDLAEAPPALPGLTHLREVLPFGRGDNPGPFLIDGVSRARAHHLLHPDAVVGHWQALALHGLPHWSDAAPVVLLSSPLKVRNSVCSRTAAARPGRPTFREASPDLVPVYPDSRFPLLGVVTAATAAAQCLVTVLNGSHGWWTPAIPGATAEEVRAVQLLDALWQCTMLTTPDLIAACHGKVARHTLDRLLMLSDPGAQSPQETALRLIAAPLLPEPLTWSSQVRVELPGHSTVLDLACRDVKVGLYYDGRHHTAPAQNLTDFEQYQDLRDTGWEVVRVDAALLNRKRDKLLGQITNAIGRAAQHQQAQQAQHSPAP
ncbi:hypothetical protein ACT3SZ_08595 [Corynebacterium sp. AOP40-9SA-29]|uniref:hypothetical protein n=1 Tax=Corynebacterium sp. AOP40-9SA-29 TaxID=3457677 RepID=UPI00403332A2